MSGITLNGRLRLREPSEIIKRRGLEPGGRAQLAAAEEALRLCAPRLPRGNGALERSGEAREGGVAYLAPYARRHYYEPAAFEGAPMRGNYWFERMKDEGGRGAVLRAAARVCGGKLKPR